MILVNILRDFDRVIILLLYMNKVSFLLLFLCCFAFAIQTSKESQSHMKGRHALETSNENH